MSFRDSVRKIQKQLEARNKAVTIHWINNPNSLTQEQIDSVTEIYLHLEI